MDEDEIIKLVLDRGFLINEDALNLIKDFKDDKKIRQVIDNISSKMDSSAPVIMPGHLKFLYNNRINVKYSTCYAEESYTGFSNLFIDRFERLSSIFKKRLSVTPIKNVMNNESRHVFVVGIVSDINHTKYGNKIITIEDETGTINVLFSKDLKTKNENILLDEVIGIRGFINEKILISEEFYRPEIPLNREKARSRGKVGLTSDIHVGSKMFSSKKWSKFIDFIRKDEEVAGDLDCIIIAGDCVDGIGVYPNQELSLNITDILDQYKEAAFLLSEIPEDIEIIILPGNHDAIRQAEPQPPLPKFIQDFFLDKRERIKFVGNPCYIYVNETSILSYHGRSLDYLIQEFSGSDYKNPISPMIQMLKMRHLSPTYGKVPMTPAGKDFLTIDDVPNILHCGHVHTFGIGEYRGTLLFNTGGWQEQTSFQYERNIVPDVGKFPIIDLETMDIKLLDFGG
ncbi:MAG: DNA-directed DNA polymerase II small subunit [Candidatus Methanoliparum thermophilum]|uniref:DNA polymerase II small subunit n=1 Tax=Methanoliparum thermophilum TaxID=2491083 RepID=A0A520KR49_METT2|nr:DNA-directed DNA polymerase II small subunit [Candidatus Methanoliparum sp. LAM-1]RZN64093.1 MAG: DNA-directed DNA polymerase II small subunit [Candidatus Methanoliparum thermophilum]BDC35646.1 hypothetical protein MTLP_03280 [Candidatus Methanoliparum sp. LAM-1]